MGWTTRNLTEKFDAPLALFGPAAYVFGTENTRHLMYLGATAAGGSSGVLYELYCGSDDVWHSKSLMLEASDAPEAVAPPTAYAFDAEKTQHVLYQSGDGHVRELYWDDGWNHNDLSESAGAPPAFGQPYGWQFVLGGRQQVVYVGVDRLVHLLTRGAAGDPSWSVQTLTDYNDPKCVVPPGGYAFEAGGSQHITYRAENRRLYEISQDRNTGKWGKPVDIGLNLGAPDVISDLPIGFADESAGTRHVDFLGADYNVHEYSFDGTWTHTNLTETTGAPLASAAARPAGYMFASTAAVPVATQHVVYLTGERSLYELWRDSGGSWSATPLTGDLGFLRSNSPTAFVNPADSTQNVFYATDAYEPVELRWTPGPPTRVVVHGQTHLGGATLSDAVHEVT